MRRRRIGFGGKGHRKDSGPRSVHERSRSDAHVQMRARATRGKLGDGACATWPCFLEAYDRTEAERTPPPCLETDRTALVVDASTDVDENVVAGISHAKRTSRASRVVRMAIRTSSRAMRCVFVSHAASAFRPAHLGPSRAPSSTATSHPRVRDAHRMWTPFRTCVASRARSRRRMVRHESHVYVRT